jgi:hypothetical protein
MRTILAILLTFHLAQASAQDDERWFTVLGNLADSETDTVQLNMAKVETRGKNDVMQLRVTLAKQRTMATGERFQSYRSQILIECAKESIVHLNQTRFELGRWGGPSEYQRFNEVRPMAFGGLEPNPKARVLRAACETKPNSSGKTGVQTAR